MDRSPRDPPRTQTSANDLRGWLSNPPLRDRVSWREGILPRSLISEDRGLLARTSGTLYLAGAAVGFAILALGESAGRNDPTIAVISVLAVLLGGVCFVGYRRLPRGFFVAMMALGTLMITAVGAGTPPGAEPVFGFFYIWVVFMACLFFSAPIATAQVLFAAISFAALLVIRDSPYTINLVISAFATFGTTGVLIAILRRHVESMAFDLTAEAHTDAMTGLLNRRGFDERFRIEVERAARIGRPLALVICDLDRFKAVNDQLGHDEGDAALRRAAASILAATRGSDHAARIGGEEFAVLLPETSGPQAYDIAERIRDGVRAEFEGFPVAVTISCGVASLAVGAGAEDLFRTADRALYAAKRSGRNRTAEAKPPLRLAAES